MAETTLMTIEMASMQMVGTRVAGPLRLYDASITLLSGAILCVNNTWIQQTIQWPLLFAS